jgi:hypothetical protein
MEIFHKFKKGGGGQWLPPGNRMANDIVSWSGSKTARYRGSQTECPRKALDREKTYAGGIFSGMAARPCSPLNITLELFDNKLLLGNDRLYQIADGDQADQLSVFQDGQMTNSFFRH